MKTNRRRFLAGASAVAVAGSSRSSLAQKKYDDGATDTEIKIGHTCPYSGPASAYGVNGKALVAYWNMINDTGGINGRKIKFISLDDGYSPPKTVELVRQLVEQEKVLCTHNILGTATNTAIHKYMNQKKVPQLYVATGASKWGDPEHFPWTMGFQPDYNTEAVIYAKHILANVKDPKIAVLIGPAIDVPDYRGNDLRERVFKANFMREQQDSPCFAVPDRGRVEELRVTEAIRLGPPMVAHYVGNHFVRCRCRIDHLVEVGIQQFI